MLNNGMFFLGRPTSKVDTKRSVQEIVICSVEKEIYMKHHRRPKREMRGNYKKCK